MPDPYVTASGERFARDMRRIREANDVSAEDIYRETMISVHIVESFERDGLFEHPTFNRVYLRSFVRSYATAVGVDPHRAVEELERALEGDYANELAVEYLGDEPETPSPPSETETPSEEEETDKPKTPPVVQSAAPSGPIRPTSQSTQPPEPEEPTRLSEESRRGVWIGIGIVILIVIAWLLIGVLRGADTTATRPGSASSLAHPDSMSVDSARLEPLPAESLETAGPEVEIGDTMYFTVIAEDRVSPVRIRRDDDLRRPYYLNRGQAAVFPARQRIVLEEELDVLRLLVNGYEYPVPSHVFNGQVVLTRDTVQAFLDTTQGEPLDLVVPVDTNEVIGN